LVERKRGCEIISWICSAVLNDTVLEGHRQTSLYALCIALQSKMDV